MRIAPIAALLAATLLASPVLAASEPQATPAPQSSETPKAAKPMTPYQQRMKACGAEWREAKKANATEGKTWREFLKSCNERLKAAKA